MDMRPGSAADTMVQHPRQGWEDQFRQMVESGDDHLLDDAAWPLSEWDNCEWDWAEIVQDELCCPAITDCAETITIDEKRR